MESLEKLRADLPFWFDVMVGSFLSNGVRYILIAGFAFILVHIVLATWYAHKRIQNHTPDGAQVRREMQYSIGTLIIFALLDIIMIWLNEIGVSKLYFDVADYGWGYLCASFFITVLIHDAYFYAIHRLMHVKPIYERVHKVHHTFTNPTPFAAYAFHPLEAALEFGVVVVLVLVMPIHIAVLIIFVVYMLTMNSLAHLGFEFFPKGFARHPIGKWFLTATHHNIHHRTFRYNFGFYFTFWDRVLGTNHPHYEDLFDEVAGREREAAAEEALRT